MKLKDLTNIIEKTTPKSIAYPWDNVGLLLGDENKEINSVLITLDVCLSTVNEAVKNHCDAIISHHPFLFDPLKRVDYNTVQGKVLKLLIENNIAVYAAHTNMDTAVGGINDALAEIFEIEDKKILEYHTDRTDVGLGRYGNLKKPVLFKDLCQIAKDRLNTPFVRAAGDFNKEIKTLCVASGSCSECIETAIAKNCDAVITGDMKYHDTINYSEAGICIIDAGHYPTECIVTDIFEGIIKDTGIKIYKSENKDIFNIVY